MDILDKLLLLAQISAGVNVKCQLQGNWRLDNPPQRGQALVHMVLRGRAYVQFSDNHEQNRWLNAGEIIFLPRLQAHALQSDRAQLGSSTVESTRWGGFTLKRFDLGEGEECEIFCLHFHYDEKAELMENLPDCLFLSMENQPWRTLVELLKQESESALGHSALGDWGTVSAVNGLALVLLTLILRTYLNQENANVWGVLKGSQEPRLRTLLRAILQAPEADWNVEQMAEFTHVSRSSLIRLFQEHLNISPHAFVHKMRLQKGAMMLRQKPDSILAIALSTGFQSETHFSKAFKKLYGVTPRAYRLTE